MLNFIMLNQEAAKRMIEGGVKTLPREGEKA
jgi:hypothetical protein